MFPPIQLSMSAINIIRLGTNDTTNVQFVMIEIMNVTLKLVLECRILPNVLNSRLSYLAIYV